MVQRNAANNSTTTDQNARTATNTATEVIKLKAKKSQEEILKRIQEEIPKKNQEKIEMTLVAEAEIEADKI